jgi:hypothetical protein
MLIMNVIIYCVNIPSAMGVLTGVLWQTRVKILRDFGLVGCMKYAIFSMPK